MAKYLFQVEAVNLSAVVYDTADISTIRGGGFYLLYRVAALARDPSYKNSLITEGASKAVIRIETENPETVRREILNHLYYSQNSGVPLEDERIKEAMFIVVYTEDTGNSQKDMALLMGKTRILQMQSPSIRLFSETFIGTKTGCDSLNRVLPSHKHDKKKDICISNFTYKRREYGKSIRKRIYQIILGEETTLKGWDFTDDLEELSTDTRQGNLSEKIAYIYIDGNKFGSLQQNLNETQLKMFDCKLQQFKRAFMKSLFELAKTHPSFMDRNKLRLETLLWGGDEITLVVPAWMGWTVATTFYNTAKDFRDETNKPLQLDSDGIKDLTFAMGLVFAHHKNPVRNLDKIARELAETVKSGLSKDTRYLRGTGDRTHYAVFESLETLPMGYENFAKRYYSVDATNLVFTAKEMIQLQDLAGALDNCFSKGKIYELTKAWDLFQKEKSPTLILNVLKRGFDTSEMSDIARYQLLKAMEKTIGITQDSRGEFQVNLALGHRWLQIAELYDYLLWKEH